MKRLLLAAAATACVLILAACGGSPAASSSDPASEPPAAEPSDAAEAPAGDSSAMGMCILAVEYDGRTYVGGTVSNPPATGASLGEGVFPPCNDTPDIASSETGEPVEVFALEGVDPADAIAVEGREEIFTAEGVDPATLSGD